MFTLPLILDGATGTNLHRAGMPEGVCPEEWILNHPDVLVSLQKQYVQAGTQLVYAPTFGANPVRLKLYGLENRLEEMNRELVALARQSGAMVAGDITSVGLQVQPLGTVTFGQLMDIYRTQAQALENAGVDAFVIETMFNLAEARAAMLAIRDVSDKPVIASFTCDKNGRTMMGTHAAAALTVMESMGVCAFGLNCSEGPDVMRPVLEMLAKQTHVPLLAKPNAGLPEVVNGALRYSIAPEEFAQQVAAFAGLGVGLFGGCCGTDPDYIAALRRALQDADIAPRCSETVFVATQRDAFALDRCEFPDAIDCDEDVGDALMDAEEDDDISATTLRVRDMDDVQELITNSISIAKPICLETEDAQVLEAALQVYQGRAAYRGNLDIAALSKKYGVIPV